MTSNARHEARDEARRLIQRLLELLDEGEHLGVPARSEDRIVIPIDRAPAVQNTTDEASMRALLAAWLDHPPSTE